MWLTEGRLGSLPITPASLLDRMFGLGEEEEPNDPPSNPLGSAALTPGERRQDDGLAFGMRGAGGGLGVANTR